MLLRKLVKDAACLAPAVHRIIETRDAAVEARDAALADLPRRFAEGKRSGVIEAIQRSSRDSWFKATLNGFELMLPRDTLTTMTHCIHFDESRGVVVVVEIAHLLWMLDRIRPGGVFLDVGASTGAMTLPVALKFRTNVTIVAFEPALAARALLAASLRRNSIEGVRIVDAAVSDQPGIVEFAEYPQDETGICPYLPEISSITNSLMDQSRTTKFEIIATTLDEFCANNGMMDRPTVVKIDVEGFEVKVLEGAREFLGSSKPSLAIDIHRNPFGEGMTEAPMRALLGDFGYSFEVLGHVLLCTPPSAAAA